LRLGVPGTYPPSSHHLLFSVFVLPSCGWRVNKEGEERKREKRMRGDNRELDVLIFFCSAFFSSAFFLIISPRCRKKKTTTCTQRGRGKRGVDRGGRGGGGGDW